MQKKLYGETYKSSGGRNLGAASCTGHNASLTFGIDNDHGTHRGLRPLAGLYKVVRGWRQIKFVGDVGR